MADYRRAFRYGVVAALVTTVVSLFGAGVLVVVFDTGPDFRYALAFLVAVVTFTTVFTGVEHLLDRRLSEDEPDLSPGTNPLSGADQP